MQRPITKDESKAMRSLSLWTTNVSRATYK